MCDQYPDLNPVDLSKENLAERVMDDTGGWGVDRFFECSGAVKAYEAIFSCCSPGAHVVLIGNNAEPVPMNWAILFALGPLSIPFIIFICANVAGRLSIKLLDCAFFAL